ncbi:hypothetical protein FKZ61_015775 [Litorilinea aerophila]|uniref:PH domain-containing protein n=1 Tax=Litorilinea aerophila TaxID=1204385 RepID=A0A540VD37_9CHLR|nr:hypothetical protein [Litorilinea aerophila]MCC9077560.1 hypothetical protein [Litorilinea aerophila]
MSTTVYTVHPRYRLWAVGAFLLAGLYAWELRRGFDLAILFFFLIALAVLAWALRALLSRVQVEDGGVTLRPPLATPTSVEYRQLISVSQDGRWNRSITLIYHPRLENGLLDLEQARTLALPSLVNQEELLATLMARMPQ